MQAYKVCCRFYNVGYLFIAGLYPIHNLSIINTAALTVSWNCNISDAVPEIYYFFQIYSSDSHNTTLNYNNGPKFTLNLTGLQPEKIYDYAIQVTLCRHKNNITDCGDEGIAKVVKTPCGGIEHIILLFFTYIIIIAYFRF